MELFGYILLLMIFLVLGILLYLPLHLKKAEENLQSLIKRASEYEKRESKASSRYHGFLFDSFSGQKHIASNRNEIERLIEIIC